MATFGRQYRQIKKKNSIFNNSRRLVCVPIVFGNYVDDILLLILWLNACFGQTLAERSSQILIAEIVPKEEDRKVYGAHPSWSHLC